MSFSLQRPEGAAAVRAEHHGGFLQDVALIAIRHNDQIKKSALVEFLHLGGKRCFLFPGNLLWVF